MAAYNLVGFDMVLFCPCTNCSITVLGIVSNDYIDDIITFYCYRDSIIKCRSLFVVLNPKPVNTNEDQTVFPLWQSQLTCL